MSVFLDEIGKIAINALQMKDAPSRFFSIVRSESDQKNLYHLRILDKSFALMNGKMSMNF